MSFQIGGKMTSAFTSAFSGATNKLVGLKNQARQTQRALDQLSNDFRKGKIHESQYAESTQRLTNELGKLERAQKRIDGFKSGVNQGFSTVKSAAGVAALGAAATATGVAMDSMSKASDFQQQITKVGVIAGASTQEMKMLSNAALDLGASTSLSSSQVAVAMGELAAKGMNTNQVISAMPGILAAAEASGEDLAMTSDVVTSALNAFGMKATQSGHIADVMAMSANKTAAGVEDLGYSFKYAAPVANTLGIKLEELAAATGIMVDKGLAGEQAGTSLRMGLMRLTDAPEEASKAMDKLGFSAVDSKGNFKSLSKITKELRSSMKGMTQAQKVQTLGTIFGTEAATGWLDLIDSAPTRLDTLTTSLEKSGGSAQKAANAMKDNYAGALTQLKGSIEAAQIKFATPLLPVFQDLFNGVSASLEKNVGGIEKAGERVANGLKKIFEPFSTQKPKKPKLKDYGSITLYQEALAQYQKDLDKFNKFDKMDFGDKIVFGLDEATAQMSKWLDGSGGESMNKIFTKLGEIAAKAWYTAFTNTVKASMSEFGQGNLASGAGLGAAAVMLGGGLIAKGAWGAGKGIYNTGKGIYNTTKGRKTPKGGKVLASVSTPKTEGGGGTKTPASSKVPPTQKGGGKVVQFPGTNKATTTSKIPKIFKPLEKAAPVLSKGAKFLSKAALPIAAAVSIGNIATSNDKARAVATEGGGLAGGLAGAAAGAALGSVVPGIGTAIGGIVGGILGGVGGNWLGGKAVDTYRGSKQPTPAAATVPPENNTQASTALNQATTQLKTATALAAHNFQSLGFYAGQATVTLVGSFNGVKSSTTGLTHNLTALTSWTGQASGWIVGSFNGIKSNADAVSNNLRVLTTWSGQASGWMASLSGIQTSGAKVKTALDNLATRINNVKVPASVGGDKRTSYAG